MSVVPPVGRAPTFDRVFSGGYLRSSAVMAGHGEKLTRKHEQAIAALLTAPTLQTAATLAGVSEKTLRTWLKLPEFQKAYAAARRNVLERTVARLLHACTEAVETLQANLHLGKPGERTRAAVAILSHAIKGTEVLDLAERIEALERLENAKP